MLICRSIATAIRITPRILRLLANDAGYIIIYGLSAAPGRWNINQYSIWGCLMNEHIWGVITAHRRKVVASWRRCTCFGWSSVSSGNCAPGPRAQVMYKEANIFRFLPLPISRLRCMPKPLSLLLVSITIKIASANSFRHYAFRHFTRLDTTFAISLAAPATEVKRVGPTGPIIPCGTDVFVLILR